MHIQKERIKDKGEKWTEKLIVDINTKRDGAKIMFKEKK